MTMIRISKAIFLPALLSFLLPVGAFAQSSVKPDAPKAQARIEMPDLSPFDIVSPPPVEDGTGGFLANNMLLRSKNLSVSISKFRAHPGSAGNWIIQISGASFRKQGDVSGYNFTIGPSSFEIGPSSNVCRIGRFRAMNISHGEVIRPTQPGRHSPTYTIDGPTDGPARQSPLKFDGLTGRLAIGESCVGSIQAKVSKLAIGDALGGALRLSDGSLKLANIPLSVSSNPDVAQSHLSLNASGVQYQVGDSLPVWTTGGVDLLGTANATSLIGFTKVISTLEPFAPGPPATELRLMQFFNAATIIDGDLDLHVKNVSISAAGAVPAMMVANFSRAGLSVMSGDFTARAALQEGKINAGLVAKIVGVGNLSGAVEGSIQPYDQAKFNVALSGKSLGFHLIPTADVSSGRISFTDLGFRNAAWTILGVSAPAYLNGLENALSKDGTSQSSLLATFLKRLEYFLRLDGQDGVGGQDRKPTVAIINPDTPASIIQILLSVLSPDARNMSPLNFKIHH